MQTYHVWKGSLALSPTTVRPRHKATMTQMIWMDRGCHFQLMLAKYTTARFKSTEFFKWLIIQTRMKEENNA